MIIYFLKTARADFQALFPQGGRKMMTNDQYQIFVGVLPIVLLFLGLCCSGYAIFMLIVDFGRNTERKFHRKVQMLVTTFVFASIVFFVFAFVSLYKQWEKSEVSCNTISSSDNPEY